MVISTTFKRKKKEQGGVRPTGEKFKRLGETQPLKGELNKKRISERNDPKPSGPEGGNLDVRITGGQLTEQGPSVLNKDKIAEAQKKQKGFSKRVTDTPLIGTTIKTIGRGIAEGADKLDAGTTDFGGEFKEELGPTTAGDIATTALTIGGGIWGKAIIGKVFAKKGLGAGIVPKRMVWNKGAIVGENITPIATVFKASPKAIEKAGEKLLAADPGILKKALSQGWVKGSLVAGGLGGSYLGFSGMSRWIASDNIISSTTFSARLIREGVDGGQISQNEGAEMMTELEEELDDAVGWVKGNAIADPTMWTPLGKPYLINAEKAKRDLELHKQLLGLT